MKYAIASLAVSGLFLSFSSTAAESIVSDPVTVTATRFPSGLMEASVNVSVLDEQDIARSGATTLAQLLQQIPGVQVLDLFGITGSNARIDTGGFGATGELNTLVLLNGRRLNDADMAGANLAALPLQSIARVEVQHGTGTVLYGDNAVGGVINIITKTGFEGPKATIELSNGSYGTRGLAANLNARHGDMAVMISAQGMESDGYRASSAFSNRNLFTEISRNSGETRYGLRASANRETTQLPGDLNEPRYLANPRAATNTLQQTSEDQQGIEAFVNGQTFAAELAMRSKNQKGQLFGTTDADLETISFTPRTTTQLGNHKLVTGLDYYRSTLSTTAEFTGAANASDARRDSLAVYLTDTWTFGHGLALQAGARRQAVLLDMTNVDLLTNARTGDERNDWLNAWDSTLSWRTSNTRSYLRLAESFRFPVLDEMWDYFSGIIAPLLPQRSQHVELGTAIGTGLSKLEANAFHILVKDEIGFDLAANGGFGANTNFDPSQHDGFNLGAQTKLGERVTLRAGYTYRDARFRAGVNDGKTIPEIPRNSGTLGIGWRFAEHQHLGLDSIYTGQRYFGDDTANVGKKMEDYTRWNLQYVYAPPGWKLRMAVENLTNIKTADIGYYRSYLANPYSYYPLPERAIKLSMEKSF